MASHRWKVSRSDQSVRRARTPGVTLGQLAPRWQGLLRSGMAGGAMVLLVLFPLANVVNFGFHAVASRMLGPSHYGELNSLLVVLLAVSVPVSALQVIVTRELVARREAGRGISIVRPVQVASLCAVLGAGLIMAGSPLLGAYLHLGSWVSVAMLGFFVFVAIVGLVPKALLLAEFRFRALALAVIGGTCMRLVLGLMFLEAGGGVSGAVLATVLGVAFTTGVVLYCGRSALVRGVESIRVRWSDGLRASVALIGFWLLADIDVLVSRHYLFAHSAGMYSAAATLARAVIFLPQAIALIALPRFAVEDRGSALKALRVAGWATILFGLMTALGLLGFRGAVVHALFGSRFTVSAALVAVLMVQSVALALISLLVQYRLARGARVAGTVWAGVALVVGVTAVWHGSALMIATSAAVTTVLVAELLCRRVADRQPVTERRVSSLCREPDVPAIDLTIVVPFYNPGPSFAGHLRRLIGALRDEGVHFEVIAVSDGCTDGSEAAVTSLGASELRCVSLHRNCGKGEALRVGFGLGRGKYLGFIDADGDLDPSLWHPFLELMRLYEADVVLGSKRHPLSEVHYPPLRWIYSWGYQQLVRLLFRLRVRDTQTGIKLVRREVLADVLPRTVEQRFAFDLEFFVVARRCGWRRFMEAPVKIEYRFHSTVSLRAVARTLLDTLAIAVRLHVLRAYDQPRSTHEDLPLPLALTSELTAIKASL